MIGAIGEVEEIEEQERISSDGSLGCSRGSCLPGRSLTPQQGRASRSTRAAGLSAALHHFAPSSPSDRHGVFLKRDGRTDGVVRAGVVEDSALSGRRCSGETEMVLKGLTLALRVCFEDQHGSLEPH